MTSSLKIKEGSVIPALGSGTSTPIPSSSVSFGGGGFGGFGGFGADDDESPKEFFIRTAVDVEFGKENGEFVVKAASIERLVDWITLNNEAPKDASGVPLNVINPLCLQDSLALLRCYPNVCEAPKFFTLFHNRLVSGTREEKLQVLRFFQVWVDKYYQRDFINKKINTGNALCNKLLGLLLQRWGDEKMAETANSVKLTILRNQAKLKSANGNLSSHSIKGKLDVSGLDKITADKKAARKLDERLPELSLLELAGQLSKIEIRMFSRITERELFDLNWKKAANKHMCRHILRLIDRSNNVSFWVATQILNVENEPEKRCNRLKKFIKLAQKCLLLNNFNTLMEILGGINLRPIQRLKQTWALLPEKYSTILKSLELMMENRYNYKTYREALKERKHPILPYLGVFLRDLTFIEEGNPTFTEKTIVNLEKMKLITTVINDIQEYQHPNAYNPYFPVLRSKERKFLKSGLVGLSEDALYDLSYKAEATASHNTSTSSLPVIPASPVLSAQSTPGTPKGERPTLGSTHSSSELNSIAAGSEEGSILNRTNSDRGGQQPSPSPTPSPNTDSVLKHEG